MNINDAYFVFLNLIPVKKLPVLYLNDKIESFLMLFNDEKNPSDIGPELLVS